MKKINKNYDHTDVIAKKTYINDVLKKKAGLIFTLFGDYLHWI